MYWNIAYTIHVLHLMQPIAFLQTVFNENEPDALAIAAIFKKKLRDGKADNLVIGHYAKNNHSIIDLTIDSTDVVGVGVMVSLIERSGPDTAGVERAVMYDGPVLMKDFRFKQQFK